MDAQCMNDKEDNLEHCNRNRRKANCLDRQRLLDHGQTSSRSTATENMHDVLVSYFP